MKLTPTYSVLDGIATVEGAVPMFGLVDESVMLTGFRATAGAPPLVNDMNKVWYPAPFAGIPAGDVDSDIPVGCA